MSSLLNSVLVVVVVVRGIRPTGSSCTGYMRVALLTCKSCVRGLDWALRYGWHEVSTLLFTR